MAVERYNSHGKRDLGPVLALMALTPLQSHVIVIQMLCNWLVLTRSCSILQLYYFDLQSFFLLSSVKKMPVGEAEFNNFMIHLINI